MIEESFPKSAFTKQIDFKGNINKTINFYSSTGLKKNIYFLGNLEKIQLSGGGSGGGTLITLQDLAVSSTFTFADFPSLSKKIETIKSGVLVKYIVVTIDIPFNNGAQITVGEDSANAELLTVSETDLSTPSIYEKTTNFLYSLNTDVKAYFIGNPTIGSGNIKLYY